MLGFKLIDDSKGAPVMPNRCHQISLLAIDSLVYLLNTCPLNRMFGSLNLEELTYFAELDYGIDVCTSL